MASVNRPNRITLDAHSDPQLLVKSVGGEYSSFTNVLKNPIIGAKGLQLVNANFINSSLQLNDQSQLIFWFYSSATQAGIRSLSNLKCVRLLPSNYVPASGYTTFVTNVYFNTVDEVCSALTNASVSDSAVYNPYFTSGLISFFYDTASRRVFITGNGTNYIAPAAADDPHVIDALLGTTTPANRIKMATFGSTNYATAQFQPFVLNESMNARLGFAMGFNTRGLYWGATSQVGCATSIGVPSNSSTQFVAADAFPILLGSQNVNVYLNVATGGGLDSLGNKNLIASIPIEVPPLAINSYTTNSVEVPSLSTPNEIYEITVTLRDDAGVPFTQYPNYNTQISLAIYY
jgi:hypothetical protein